jgi:hypothetical protein
VIILAIICATWVGLTIYAQGVDRTLGPFLAHFEIPSWEPAAGQPTPDRPEDAFQRAWNKSEERVHEAMAGESPAN